jgi:hypothetical protein
MMCRKQFGLLMATAAMAGLVGGLISGVMWRGAPAVAQEPSEVRPVMSVEEMHLLDREGNIRARLSLSGRNNPLLEFLGEDESPKISLGVMDDGKAMLAFRQKTSAVRAELSLPSGGRPMLALNDEKGDERAALFLVEGDKPMLRFKHRDRTASVLLTALPDGSSGLMLKGRDGQEVVLSKEMWEELVRAAKGAKGEKR